VRIGWSEQLHRISGRLLVGFSSAARRAPALRTSRSAGDNVELIIVGGPDPRTRPEPTGHPGRGRQTGGYLAGVAPAGTGVVDLPAANRPLAEGERDRPVRGVPGSIHYRTLPGLRRDEVLRAPYGHAQAGAADPAEWWRLAAAG
jgi:hypothetical protein